MGSGSSCKSCFGQGQRKAWCSPCLVGWGLSRHLLPSCCLTWSSGTSPATSTCWALRSPSDPQQGSPLGSSDHESPHLSSGTLSRPQAFPRKVLSPSLSLGKLGCCAHPRCGGLHEASLKPICLDTTVMAPPLLWCHPAAQGPSPCDVLSSLLSVPFPIPHPRSETRGSCALGGPQRGRFYCHSNTGVGEE